MTGKMGPYNASVEAFREQEYSMLKDNIYLDHAGTTLYSRSLVDRFAADMMANLLGNPHAASASSQAAGHMIEDIRLRTLQFFHADPAEFDLVFVLNATAGAKLVTEAFRALPGGFTYAYHQACHTSLVGVREEARNAVCLPSEEVEAWAAGDIPEMEHAGVTHTLFAYPAQSNMDGRRFPFSWAHRLRNQTGSVNDKEEDVTHNKKHIWTLLDAAAYAATSPLNLSNAATAPDFTLVSFYKIFGFPDLGGLIVRRPAEPLFDSRRYFGGGTVDMVVCAPQEQWHATKGGYGSDSNRNGYALHDRLEDGTLPVHNIAALGAALDTHAALFGSMSCISAHASFLADRLHHGLVALHHGNGSPVCHIYSPDRNTEDAGGPIVAFNLQNARGAWISLAEFDKLATLKKIHLRTGGVCNPGGVTAALGLAPWELRRNFSRGLRCGSDEGGDDIVAGKPTGIIRVSLGAMSTIGDVDRFLTFLNEFYRDDSLEITATPFTKDTKADNLVIASINVYPIKSCGAFEVPHDMRWAVRPEGLAWDREWCLVHRGTRRALSQKQYPKMVLLRPVLDFEQGVLRVSYAGPRAEWAGREVTVPLSNNPAMFKVPSTTTTVSASSKSRSSRVCGEEIAAQVYTSDKINDFFSQALGIPCLLARFPPGGQGTSMRHSKAHLQKYQRQTVKSRGLPSPPDSDSERTSCHGHSNMSRISEPDDTSNEDNSRDSAATRQRRRILLSNESPILAIHMTSLRELNRAIKQENGQSSPDVDAAVFRANIVLDSPAGEQGPSPYAEDAWSKLRIGQQSFKLLGACRRCHMVCVNQETAIKSDEPFVTLTKTRRFDGKVFFGTHMGHDPSNVDPTDGGADVLDTPEKQFPTIMVGESVAAE